MSRDEPPGQPGNEPAAPPANDRARSTLVKQLVARTPSVRTACDFDLIAFLHRHPRTMLTTDQLASFVGYNLKDIARSLDTLIEAGVLERMAQQSAHAARMFVLLPDAPQAGGMPALLELGATREGRKSILETLKARDRSRPELRLLEPGRRAAG